MPTKPRTFHERCEDYLRNSNEGRRLLRDILDSEGMSRGDLIAISHATHVDLYSYGPGRVRQYNQIHAETPEGEILAEQIVEAECKRELWPYATFGKFGKIGTVSQVKLPIEGYLINQLDGELLKGLEKLVPRGTKS